MTSNVGVSISEEDPWVTFFMEGRNLCTIKVEPRILKEDLYPCVGFRFAKDASVIVSKHNDFELDMSHLDIGMPNYCPVKN